MTLRELLGTTAALLILMTAGPLAAQDTAGARSEGVAVEDDGSDGGGDRLADLEEAIKAQQDRIDTLEKKEADAQGEVEELKGQLEEMKEEQEMAQLEALDTGEDYATEKKMQVYGFFDTTFVKNFFKKNSPFDLYFPNKSSFMMSSVNLYFKSQMTQTLSAMVETKLIYFPHGWEESYPTVVVMNNDDGTQTTVLTDGEYNRTNTQVRDQNTLGYTKYGGIAIERAHLTYKPFDWLGIMAGRYLTPYGIWNVDHGTPVLLSIRVPYLQTRESVPLSQMGVQVFGRFYPGPDLFFDYAFTVSNGRGPIDTIMDLDENKGLGLRLRLSYEGKNLTVSAGAYGYMGEYTDSQKEIFVQVDPNLHLDESADMPIQALTTVNENYDEMVLATDLLIEFFGIRMQGEYVRRRVDYKEVTPLESIDVLFSDTNLTQNLYTASFIGNSFYALLAYTLPLDKWISPVKITPYGIYENVTENDTLLRTSTWAIAAGLNIKPSPFVSIKLEYGQATPKNDVFGTGRQVGAQVAVSF